MKLQDKDDDNVGGNGTGNGQGPFGYGPKKSGFKPFWPFIGVLVLIVAVVVVRGCVLFEFNGKRCGG